MRSRKYIILTLSVLLNLVFSDVVASPVKGLLERIDKGSSSKFIIEIVKPDKSHSGNLNATNANSGRGDSDEDSAIGATDFFELDQKGDKVVVRGNNYVSIATGINWYLKYYAGIHLSWNCMSADLPDILPPVKKKERHETSMTSRYDFNYCTYSYTMAFWDWNRWEKEIDWMALHGINMPLAVVGAGTVWRNVLLKLGYSREEVNDFVAGPAFQAWWLMNNLEGWGGPNPDSWYNDQAALQKKIIKRMREYGIEPVLPGYSGMVPNNAKEKLGLDVANPGLWCGYRRPAFLQPTDSNFQRIADIYYKELTRLFGKARFYSMDPFHEGGNVAGVDLDAAGKAIYTAMKKCNKDAVWVAQAWQRCPYDKMIENIPQGDLIVLDLFSESRPQWGDPSSTWYRKNGFGKHNWLYCMLLNYGGNVGLHGKMKHLIDGFYEARDSRFGSTLKGVGMTMEGTENNPVMYELLCELPWRKEKFSKDEWLEGYVKARYGFSNSKVLEAWNILSESIYNCPKESVQQGTHESVFCARPSLNTYQVSSWSEMKDYYNPEDVIRAAGIMVDAVSDIISSYGSEKLNDNFRYDLVDIVRQAVAEKGRLVYPIIVDSYKAGEKDLFKSSSVRFLELISLQDRLLATRSEFRVGSWIKMARDMGRTEEEKNLYEWNARVQITTWGNRNAADNGGLRDYAHREWNGLLADFYYMRWKTYFDYLSRKLNGENPEKIDFYGLEEKWTLQNNHYDNAPQGDVIETCREVYSSIR